MKSFSRFMLPCFMLVFIAVACGYHNPYVYSGPEISVYIPTWKNRTNELRLDAKIYQSLVKWYQKSGGSIKVKKGKEGADLMLAGEIVSIDLPSLSFAANNTSAQVKVRLTVRYILKNIKTNKVLIEVSSQTYDEAYTVSGDITTTKGNESKALDTIIDDLSEKIYMRTLTELQQPENKPATSNPPRSSRQQVEQQDQQPPPEQVEPSSGTPATTTPSK